MPKPKTVSPNRLSEGVVPDKLDKNRKLNAFKKAQGLPTWKEMQADERKGLATAIEEKFRRMTRFVELNQQIIETAHAAGWDVTNILHNIVSLQNNLLEYEEALREKGINPIEDDAYMRARSDLAKEVQFVSKHKLDVASFKQRFDDKKKVLDDDTIFEVGGGKDE